MGIPGNTKADSSAKSFYLLHSISSVFPSAFELRRLVRDEYISSCGPGSGRTIQSPYEARG